MTKRVVILLLFGVTAAAQLPQRASRELPDALGLEQGTVDADLPGFTLKLVRSSLTVAALQPKGQGSFDFTPSDRLRQRAGNGYHHLGDLILRVRAVGGEWKEYDTARERKPVLSLSRPGSIGAADLSPTLPADCPLHVEREWTTSNGRLGVAFTLKNNGPDPVEIGGLGIPMVFNNILTDRLLKNAHETCTFFDPYVGQDAGYLQVTRLSGKGPALVVTPMGGAGRDTFAPLSASSTRPSNTPFEAWMPLNEPTRPNQTFEGTFAWMVHTKAYAEREWSKSDPWNPPTSETLQPGETRRYGVQFLLSPDIRSIEKTLANAGRPVAIGVPGYILPMDQEGRLFLRYHSPIRSMRVEPQGALVCRVGVPSPAGAARGQPAPYTVQGKKWGRARLTITYADGIRQSLHYYVTKPASQAVADLGRFLFTKQWFVDPSDPFHRSPSVMSYDREPDRHVTQDSRVWIAGLGDEAGSGSWLAAAMKLFVQPDRAQVAKYAQFVDNVLWGGIQFKEGPNKYGVRKSLFYYDPKELPHFPYDPARDWRSWTSWNKRASEDIGRGYNYPHVVAAYWSMYRVERFGIRSAQALVGANNSENHFATKATGSVPSYSPSGGPPRERANKPDPELIPANQPKSPAYSPLRGGASRSWQWYLNQAYETTKFAFSRDAQGQRRVGYVELGLMEGDIFLALLEDLKREGERPASRGTAGASPSQDWSAKAAEIEALMRERADRWSHEEYPFGSEMAWDSTGQEEVYAWCRYFGHEPQAQVSLSSILGYMPTLPHWGYNGNARRYWDFLYGGKLTRIERQLHHYGSGLNALPVLAEYRRHPDDFYLLRVGYGGMMGALSNIDQDGFASAAFHSFPSTLKWDAYSGDYGPNFFGHAMGSATYVVHHPEFGWLAFGGNVRVAGNRVRVDIRDSLRQRLFIAGGPDSPALHAGLWLSLDSGQFDRIEIDTKTGAIRIGLVGRPGEGKALLRVDGGTLQGYRKERGAFIVPLSNGVTWVTLGLPGSPLPR